MKFDDILFATQYYRSPTPLINEWEDDLKEMTQYGLNTIQIRINWRNNERQEDVYTFSDVDNLMLLAEQLHKKVIIKFLLECAPQYIFDKYQGTRIGPKGEQVRGGSHGAFYAGGWLPCFTNPKVMERAVKFVKTVASRYAGRKNIVLWSAWNEPRNKPIDECFCPECRKAYGEYLKKKYKTIENLNNFYGVCEESFEHIALPSMAHGYWDIYEFKQFKSRDCIYNNLKNVYDAIREYDKVTPIVSHSGYTSGFQCHLGDCIDDYMVSKSVDNYGTSIPCSTKMNTKENRLNFMLLNDFLRSICDSYFLYEIYPGLGMFKYEYDDKWDMSFKLNMALASGAKGLNFWQYRSERVGNEGDCAGLVRMDGSPREVINAVKETSELLNRQGELLADLKAKQAEIAVIFDYNSLLMSEIEDSCGADYSFELYQPRFAYHHAHQGMYKLLRNNDYPVDYLNIHDLEKFKDYKVLYFPYAIMLLDDAVPYLKDYLENGGVVIADEGFAMRQNNTWMEPYDLKVKNFASIRLVERRFVSDEKINYMGDEEYIYPYKSQYYFKDSKTLLSFKDGSPAIQIKEIGKGKLYLLGFSIGSSYYMNQTPIWFNLLDLLLKDTNITKYEFGSMNNDLIERRLVKNNQEYVYLINAGNQDIYILIKDSYYSILEGGIIDNNILIIPSKNCALLKKGN